MCCRYFIRESDPDLMPIVDAALKSPLIGRFAKVRPAPLIRYGEVKPTDLAAVIASDRQQKPAVFPVSWGFTVPGRSAPLINARSETASEKQSFAESWKQHRCIIPASWYYECLIRYELMDAYFQDAMDHILNFSVQQIADVCIPVIFYLEGKYTYEEFKDYLRKNNRKVRNLPMEKD